MFVQGDEFLYVDDWGEQLTDKSNSVLCVLDVVAASTSTLDNLPEDVFPGQVRLALSQVRTCPDRTLDVVRM